MTEAGGGKRRKRVRKPAHTPFYRKRSFSLVVLLSLIAALLVVTGIIIYLESPRRRKYNYFQDGLAAYQREEYGTASILFRRFLTLEPDSPEAHYMLGLCHFRAGEVERAVASLRAAVAADAGYDRAHLALAEHYRERGDIRAAMASARAAIDTDPVPAGAFVLLAEIRVGLGDSEGAIEAFRRALELEPDRIEAILKLGDLYRSRKYLGIGDVREGLARGRYERALELARDRLESRPSDVDARVFLAKALAGLGRFPEAIQSVETVVRERPGEPGHRLLLSRLLVAAGRSEEAEQVLAAAMDEAPDPDLALQWAHVTDRDRGDRDAAIRILESAAEAFPDDPGIRITLVGLLLAARRTEEAEAVLGAARERFPGSSAVKEAEGDLLALAGRDGALEAFRAAVESNPQNLSARWKLIDLLLPRVLDAIDTGEPAPGDREELTAHLDYFLDPETGVNPADQRARGALARLAFAEGNMERVTALLAGGSGIATRSWVGLRILGIASLRTGDYEQAALALFEALGHRDCAGRATDFELAYQAAYRAGQFGREVEIARRAVAKWPEDPEWRLRLARSLVRDRETGAALEECRAARDLLAGTRDVRAHLLGARIRQARGEIALARRMLEEAVVVRRDAETRGALYAFLAATGDAALAEKGFRTLIEEHPDDPDAFLSFGDFLDSRGDTDGAAAQYETAVRLAPSSVAAIQRLSEFRIAKATGEEEAILAAQRAVEAIEGVAPDHALLSYFRGKLHLLRGEPEMALPLLRAFARERPDDAAGSYYLAIAYRRTGDLDRASRQFLAALGLDSDMVEAKLELATLFFTQGVLAHQRGDLAAARDAFRQVTEFDPNEPETRRFLADTLARLGRLDLAAEEAREVLARRPDDPGAIFLVALSAAGRGDWTSAEKGFGRLVRLAPENYRSHLYLGMARTELGRYDEARENLREAWRREPGGRDVLRAIAGTELLAGNVVEAIRLVEAERVRSPGESLLHHLLGDLYREADRPDDAVAAYRRAFELSSEDTGALGLAAAVLADGGELERAIALLVDGEARTRTPAGLKTLRGRMLFALGRRDEAELAFGEALDADPGMAEAARELGLLYLDTDRRVEGERLLKTALSARPADPTGWFRLAYSAAEDGRWEEAEHAYGRVLALVPGDPATLNNLALVLSNTEARRAEAIRIARQVARARPDDPRHADTLGWVLYRDGKFEEAARILRAAAEALKTDAEAWFHAGMACYRAFLWEEARPLLRRALELSEDFSGAEEAKAALREMG